MAALHAMRPTSPLLVGKPVRHFTPATRARIKEHAAEFDALFLIRDRARRAFIARRKADCV
jgi:hypothetical protein